MAAVPDATLLRSYYISIIKGYEKFFDCDPKTGACKGTKEVDAGGLDLVRLPPASFLGLLVEEVRVPVSVHRLHPINLV